ncbi:polyphosphate polymerase domain-containing protein [Microbacterium sp. M3]|uniref:Polyphosphate polymerase domain-containing protein n=1 Tax=Microbacterium arthrosphaerae TaxID=792652 RepID=A0ABU4GWF1_9MICO|nr:MULTISPECIES: polyphosphate polymerase domain-containing protein [Microbacterium]MDW4571397.1 polyphosphate polymerase domain-containing protein [Microbacterium arthrosphaerae]MDW7605252.1 polyphosphate polymerase domain-containing protein [Microbacterium sp. M3]
MTTFDRFAPVTLDALVAEASFLTRVDRKYIVPRADLDRLIAALDPGTRALEIDGRHEFSYESVYFDTPDLLSFRMAAQPRRRRFKLRTRSYLDTGTSYLEIKTRGARGTTVKDRGEYDTRARHRLTDEARNDVADAFATIGVAGERAADLDATLLTRYRRATLLAPDGAGRATVDTALEWVEPDGHGFALPGTAIVETKSGARPSDVDRVLWRAGHRPATVSKYATGLAALHPELPRNRWARLLRGPFEQARRAAPAQPATTPPTTPIAIPEEDPSCSVAA